MTGTKYMTLAEAAEELGVSYITIRRWSAEGHFPTFHPPRPHLMAASPGPKLLRIKGELESGPWRITPRSRSMSRSLRRCTAREGDESGSGLLREGRH